MKLIDVLLENEESPVNKALEAAQAMDKAIDTVDPSLGVKDFAKAVAIILKGEEGTEGYGTHNLQSFMEVLHAELGMNESLTEEMMSGIKKLDFAFIDGTTRLYATYVYLKDGRGNQWDKKLGTQETEELLNSLGINIEFDYYNIGSIIAALKEKGIEATDSEFDVS